jgi:hypothetical protein
MEKSSKSKQKLAKFLSKQTRWRELPRELSSTFINTLHREVMAKAMSSTTEISPDSPLKRLKLDTTIVHAREIMESSFYYGIHAVRDNIEDCTAIIVLHTGENDALVEPLLYLGAEAKIHTVAINFDI